MAKRRVHGVVNASDADVGAGAPGFRATRQSKDDLRPQVMKISDVPNNGKLYFWDGELWLRWDDPDDLPGPKEDPLHKYITVFAFLQRWFTTSIRLLIYTNTCQVQEGLL